MEKKDKYTCETCGKTFRDKTNLSQHMNRKSPCFIQEIKPENKDNPNRCRYCNKIFSRRYTLIKHTNSCGVKFENNHNEKIKNQQELRILKEKDKEKDLLIKKMQDDIIELKKSTSDRHVPDTVVINNGTINNINIQVRDWTDPSIEKIKLTVENLTKTRDMQQLFFYDFTCA